MKLLADESIDNPVVSTLRNEGFDVVYILETYPGISDVKIINLSVKLNRTILTADKDFGELTFRHMKRSNGIVLLRLAGLSNTEKSKLVKIIFSKYANKFVNNFTVISKFQTRIRKIKF